MSALNLVLVILGLLLVLLIEIKNRVFTWAARPVRIYKKRLD